LLKSHLISNIFEAGCDEAGRGCLVGPVYAAAVILPPSYSNRFLNDSKKLTPDVRDRLRPEIEHDALAWAVASVDHEKIDEINILEASIYAMHLALNQLLIRPGHILIDGNRFHPYREIPHTCVIRGDGIYASIAAASVLAKTWRDEYMVSLHRDWPQYGWDKNKGYPTARHRTAIRKYGFSPFHRKSFSFLVEELDIIF
jgi:ribonuclease HII